MNNMEKKESKEPFVRTSERYSHINDVETPEKSYNVRFGRVEQEEADFKLFMEEVPKSGENGIWKTRDRKDFASSVNRELSEGLKEILKGPDLAEDIRQVAENRTSEKKGVFSVGLRTVDRVIEQTLRKDSKTEEIDVRARRLGQRYGYKAGKYAVLGGFAASRGVFRYTKLETRLSREAASGVLTKSAAKTLLKDQLKESTAGTGKALAGVIKTEAVQVIENFQGSDDLGIQAVTKPRDVLVKANRTLKMTKNAGRSLQKGFQTTKKAAGKVKDVGKAAWTAGKKLLSNPVVLKGMGIAAIIVVIIASVAAIISCIASMIPTFSLKSEDREISLTYSYITELDAKMQEKIEKEEGKAYNPAIDQYHYYLNGNEVPKEQLQVYTNADLVLSYLDSKYEDYFFSGFINGLFSTTVKGEIEEIHKKLHKLEISKRTEKVTESYTYTDIFGREHTGETTKDEYHLDIKLTTQTWEDYYAANKDTLLDPEQQQQYDTLQEVGVYTFRQKLSSPFPGIDWSQGLSSRWGWRIHPIKKNLAEHRGLDIAMPGGTPISACNNGTVETNSDPDGWGNYVRVVMENGDYTLYGHMESFAVSNGQTVMAGDVIGYVGSTGSSTGNHLHLEYHQNGENLNPLIFTACEKQSP